MRMQNHEIGACVPQKKKSKKKNVQFLTKRKLDQLRTSRKINILLLPKEIRVVRSFPN